jgi:hypothetical protein
MAANVRPAHVVRACWKQQKHFKITNNSGYTLLLAGQFFPEGESP